MKKALLLALLPCVTFVFPAKAQTTRTAGTYTALTSAISASADGDIISITKNIVVTAAVAISKSITINGNGYTISVVVQ